MTERTQADKTFPHHDADDAWVTPHLREGTDPQHTPDAAKLRQAYTMAREAEQRERDAVNAPWVALSVAAVGLPVLWAGWTAAVWWGFWR